MSSDRSEETDKWGQSIADIDRLEEQLNKVEDGDSVRLTWTSNRSKNDRSAEGIATKHPVHGIQVKTDDLKGDLRAYRHGDWEISVKSKTPQQGRSLGWLVDFEFLDRSSEIGKQQNGGDRNVE